MSIGDVNSTERGSGARYNDGKADFSLIPLWTMEGEAHVWSYGRQKYAAWNWAKGMNWSVPYGSLMRHLSAWQDGEELDPESGLPHLAHAMCNLRMLTMYAKTFTEGDDRPPTMETLMKKAGINTEIEQETFSDLQPIKWAFGDPDRRNSERRYPHGVKLDTCATWQFDPDSPDNPWTRVPTTYEGVEHV